MQYLNIDLTNMCCKDFIQYNYYHVIIKVVTIITNTLNRVPVVTLTSCTTKRLPLIMLKGSREIFLTKKIVFIWGTLFTKGGHSSLVNYVWGGDIIH